MNDKSIRAVLRKELIRKYGIDKDTLVLDELGIGHGSARIDLVVINHRLHGYEIKSDQDSLRRLPDQIATYNRVMDRMTLVVGYRHAYGALRIVPEWWGVKLVKVNDQNAILMSEARTPRDNPNVDMNAVAALLWRDEALMILNKLGLADGVRSKRRADIYRRLADVVGPDQLRDSVRRQLKAREGWRVDEQRMSYDG